MARDDYYVIVYKVLAYLYVQLKTGERVDTELIMPGGKLCNINERYWTYIISHMLQDGYVEGINVPRTGGGDPVSSVMHVSGY